MVRTLCAAAALTATAPRTATATLPVVDYAHIAQDGFQEVLNYIQYLGTEVSAVATQINTYTTEVNSYTQIANQVAQLRRFGDPNYYINMLQLDSLAYSVQNLERGVGQTISAYEQTASGYAALRYTGNSLYADLTRLKDEFGQLVNFNQDDFKKFGMVSDMYRSYDQELGNYNTQIASLQQQLKAAMDRLNAASTQMETAKYTAQINAIDGQINALGHRMNAVGQRVIVQQTQNQNDAARMAEAQRQQRLQERAEEIQSVQSRFQGFLTP
jgi:chromosome segregation ATPase